MRGVAAAMLVAQEYGFKPAHNSTWINLGRGAPETGTLPGQPSRSFLESVPALTLSESYSYPPISGVKSLRVAIANYYNRLYRTGFSSQYTYENVLVCAGGRNALLRVFASLHRSSVVDVDAVDYPAYADFIELFQLRSTLSSSSSAADVIIRSNPTNPTASLLPENVLRRLILSARYGSKIVVLDEFYSHYVYEEVTSSVSGAEFIEDVEKQYVFLINGLTKNFRLPGARIAWVVAPKRAIKEISNRAFFLDGGANHLFQRLAVSLLSENFVERDMHVLQQHFRKKRDYFTDRLRKLGINVAQPPKGTFYVFADISNLPFPINDGEVLFRALLERGVIVVPGIYFELNNKAKLRFSANVRSRVRFSFGPPLSQLRRGLDVLDALVHEYTNVAPS